MACSPHPTSLSKFSKISKVHIKLHKVYKYTYTKTHYHTDPVHKIHTPAQHCLYWSQWPLICSDSGSLCTAERSPQLQSPMELHYLCQPRSPRGVFIHLQLFTGLLERNGLLTAPFHIYCLLFSMFALPFPLVQLICWGWRDKNWKHLFSKDFHGDIIHLPIL